ncbi:hypothetical protein Rsub_00281 [Raphidocelis subcapitata]|uniref:Uncharacterized protein n=1 Tax=Raphidocelis subcapitata TaxID=307507 RepID=A0A2V0NPY7_9CHLO|nr:hypothetical protein Rsub_00281 [Raphidocelis subcapitata]|eukprot:GBF87570.1 hypothetical protein Rsub_00281 [Raphidocelis subcapitata]
MGRRAACLLVIAGLLASALAADAAGGRRAQRRADRAERRAAKAAQRAERKAQLKTGVRAQLSAAGGLKKINCGSKSGPLGDAYINGCDYCWFADGMDPADVACAVCKNGFRLGADDGSECECTRNYQEKCPNRDEPCCRRCPGNKYSAGGGDDCENIGKRYAFGVTVRIDRPCADAEAAAIQSNMQTELGFVAANSSSLFVLFSSCDDVPAPRDAGVGPWGDFTYRVEYYTDTGPMGADDLKYEVRNNLRVTCNTGYQGAPYFDTTCELRGVGGAPGAHNPTLTRRWAIAVPVKSGEPDGGCPDGERLAQQDAEVRQALAPSLQLLVGMVHLRSVEFVQCNKLSRDFVNGDRPDGQTRVKPLIEFWYNVVEAHDYFAATDLEVSPYTTLYEYSVSNPDNGGEGGMSEVLPLLADTLKPAYDDTLSYVGPQITCLAGGPRVYPVDPAANSTAAGPASTLYYFANGGKVTEVGEFFDPRPLAPWAVVAQAGGASVALVDDQEDEERQGALLEAGGVNGDYSLDRVVAIGVLATGEPSGLTCPGFDTQSAASASAKTMMGTLGALSAIEITAEDYSEDAIKEAGLADGDLPGDFDFFAVVLKVTNTPFGDPVLAKDVVDLVFQNGAHQEDVIDLSDPTDLLNAVNGTDPIRWYQVRRDLSVSNGGELALITARRSRGGGGGGNGSDPLPYPTLKDFAAGETYSAGAVNDRGGTLGVKSVALSGDSRVIGAGVALLPKRPYMETVEEGDPAPLLNAPRRYLAKQLVLKFENPFPATGDAPPQGFKPAVYTLVFGNVVPPQ